MTENSDTGVIRLQSVDDFIGHTTELIGQTVRELRVLSTDLEADWLGSEAVTDALRRFALGNRRASVHILVTDATAAVKANHRWLELIRRLSRLQCQVIKADILDSEPLKGTFVLSDRRGLVYRGALDAYTGFAHYDDRATVRQQREIFDQYWRYSQPSAEFRTLAL